MPDSLREEVEKAILAESIGGDGKLVYVDDAVSVALVYAKRAEEAEAKVWALELTQEESDECMADLFALVCAVLDNKSEANEARVQLQKHIGHVRACQKGSCGTELRGSRLRQERDEARKALAEYRETVRRFRGALENIRDCVGGDDPANGMDAPEDVWEIADTVLRDPRCAPEVKP